MILSIIVPVYKNRRDLKKFLGRLKEQTSKDFQVVFVVDTNATDPLGIISEHKKDFKYDVVFNSSRTGRASALKDGIRKAKGMYSIILSTCDHFKKNFVSGAITLLEQRDSDIVEFNTTIKEPIKFEGKIRIRVPKSTKISERKEIVAYSYFSDFNKFVKTAILKKTLSGYVSKQSNSRFSIDLSSKVFDTADTYSNVNKTFITSRSKIGVDFNPLKAMRQWGILLKSIENEVILSEYSDEVAYVCYTWIVIFVFAMTGVSKNKLLLKKISVKHKKLLEDHLSNFFEANQYIMRPNAEAKFLHNNSTPRVLAKLYKEFE